MRKVLTILVYTLVVLLIGRNIPSLPRFNVLTNETSYITDLKKETRNLIPKEQGNYSVYFININDKQSFGINEEMTYTAASVNKVPIVAVLYYRNHQGKINLEDQITLQERDIQDYGTGTLRYQKPGGVYSLRTLARLALQQSDNTAAHILSERIGRDVIQSTIESWGLTQTDMEENRTSPKDMGILFQKMYMFGVTSPALTRELFGFMKDTDIEDRLPKQLPTDAGAFHKTGDAVGHLHDVGIISQGDLVFYLGVMTSDIGQDEAKAKETIASIAKNTIEFYAKRQ